MFRLRSLAASLAVLVSAVVLAPAPGHAAPAAGSGGTIAGTLTTAKGAPVAGIRVQVKSSTGADDQLPLVRTDEAGHYELAPLPAGQYRIGFYFPETLSTQWVPRKARESQATWFTVRDGETTIVDEALFPTGGLRITLRAADGASIPGFCVDAIGELYLKAGCTAEGVLVLSDLPVGTYALSVAADGNQGVSRTFTRVVEDVVTPVEARLR
ncbi:MSCRAMM family protein [Pseudosporangium ferrugineum]|uniref:Carboxypeptidase family protein n=1 Tax=Pseudosporangium ferrugineum TaxID=439699 RepID=A0A2T0S116_9ACTN|nr:carboxypeptidase-like regulatory domain-containing protein [Pseudosporangium ferrugineum]PRY27126.1 carboxypeptidase family protein [Pseudosporangium ferrugineum]